MSNQVVEMYEQKVKELEVQLNAQTVQLLRLKESQKITKTNIATISGAIQAYTESARLFKAPEQAEAQQAPIVLEGEVV